MSLSSLQVMLFWACLPGCDPASVKLPGDSGTADSGTDSTGATDSSGSTDSGGRDSPQDSPDPEIDLDGDGVLSGGDCDDTRPDVHPGAPEVWDGVDNDCDGTADGDGRYTGTCATQARAVFEGSAYSFSLSCPATLDRSGSNVQFTLACTPDPADAMAQLLLGAQLTLSGDPAVAEDRWEGLAELASSDSQGVVQWDTNADASLLWSGFGAVRLQGSLGAFSLSWAADGTLSR